MQLGNQGTLNLILSMCIESLAVTLRVCPWAQRLRCESESLSVYTEALAVTLIVSQSAMIEFDSLSVCTDALAVNLRVCPYSQRHWLQLCFALHLVA